MATGEEASGRGEGAPPSTRNVTARVRPLPRGRLATLFADATVYPIQFAGPDHIDFVPMTYESYHRSTFLDRRIQPAVPEVFRAEVQAVEAVWANAAPRDGPSLVFHSAYCCSTLLANALSQLPQTLVLKEPVTLLQVALGLVPQSRLPLVQALLSRRDSPSDRVVVKASSACNVLAADLLSAAPNARALFLYSDLRSFLLAVLKDPNRAARMRETLASTDPGVRNFAKLGGWWPEDETPPGPTVLDDARLAAWVWIGRLRAFARMQHIAGPGRVSALDGARVASTPGEALAAATTTLGLAAEPRVLEAILSGDLWQRHAKSPGFAFDRKARDRELADLGTTHRAVVADALDFARTLIARGRDATFAAPRALSGLDA